MHQFSPSQPDSRRNHYHAARLVLIEAEGWAGDAPDPGLPPADFSSPHPFYRFFKISPLFHAPIQQKPRFPIFFTTTPHHNHTKTAAEPARVDAHVLRIQPDLGL